MLLLAVRVGVLVAGGDPAGAPLAAALESRLALVRDVTVASQADIAQVFALPDARPPSSAAALVRQAEEAYFAGELATAEKALADADAAIAKEIDAVAERVRAGLVRAAIALKRNDAAAAAKAAADALALDPDAKADAYPPSVQQVVEGARAKLPARVTLKVIATPATASVIVDGREAAGGVITVVPGTHVVIARGPGLETVRRSVNVAKPGTMRIALAAKLPGEADASLAAWTAAANGTPPGALVSFLAKAGLDRVIVLAAKGAEVRAASVTTSGATFGGPFAIASGESAALYEWAAREVKPVAPATATPVVTPRDPVTQPVARKPLVKRPSFWALTGVAALAIGAGAFAASQPPKKDDGSTVVNISGASR